MDVQVSFGQGSQLRLAQHRCPQCSSSAGMHTLRDAEAMGKFVRRCCQHPKVSKVPLVPLASQVFYSKGDPKFMALCNSI